MYRTCIFFVSEIQKITWNPLDSGDFSLFCNVFRVLLLSGTKRAKRGPKPDQPARPFWNSIRSITDPILLISPSIKWPYILRVVDTSLWPSQDCISLASQPPLRRVLTALCRRSWNRHQCTHSPKPLVFGLLLLYLQKIGPHCSCFQRVVMEQVKQFLKLVRCKNLCSLILFLFWQFNSIRWIVWDHVQPYRIIQTFTNDAVVLSDAIGRQAVLYPFIDVALEQWRSQFF